MIRLGVIAVLFCFGANCVATEADVVPAPQKREIEPEIVVHHHSLAAHLGLTDDEAVFRAPRNMRSSELNNLRLEEPTDATLPTTGRH